MARIRKGTDADNAMVIRANETEVVPDDDDDDDDDDNNE